MTDVFQMPLFMTADSERVVNVASVPQRSVFRYPGGKTWLVPSLRQWLASLRYRPAEFYEPFAGGGIISLTVAFERFADHVTMVEKDPQVAAVWKTLLDAQAAETLAQRILAFDLTDDSVRAVLATPATTTEDRAFQTILKNRVYHGGILAPGASLLRFGENGKGIRSRWYPATLARRIRDLAAIRDTITFIEGDGFSVIETNQARSDSVWFFDPPYTASKKRAGSRLYNHFDLDHSRLFDLAQGLAGDFLMTYDDAEEIEELARAHGFETRLVAMTNTHHATMQERLIGRRLNWTQNQCIQDQLSIDGGCQ